MFLKVFYKPLLENGILAKNELQSLFSNVVQLLQVNCELLEVTLSHSALALLC